MSDASMTHPHAALKCLKCGSVGRRVACQVCGEILYCTTQCLCEDEESHKEPCELFRAIVRPAFANTNVARLFSGFLDMADFHTCQLEREKAAIEKCLAGMAATKEAPSAVATTGEVGGPQPGEVDLHLDTHTASLFCGFGADVCVVDATFGGESGASECPALRFLPLAMSSPPSTEDVTRGLLSFASAAIRDLQREGISTVRFVVHWALGATSPQIYLMDEGVFVIPPAVITLVYALATVVTKTFSGMPLAVRDHLLDWSTPVDARLLPMRWPRFVRHATGGQLVPSVDERWVGEWVRQALRGKPSVLATALDAKADQDMAKLKTKGKAIDKGVLVKQQLGRLERDAVAEFIRIVDSFRTAEPKPIDQLLNTLTGRPPADARLPSVDDPETAREKEEAVLDRLAEERRQANDLTETVKRLRDFERSIKSALAIHATDDLLDLLHQLDSYLTLQVDYTHWAKLLKETTDLWRTICFKVKQSPDKQVKAECATFHEHMTEGFLCAETVDNSPTPPKRPKVFLDLQSGRASAPVRRVVITLFTDVNPKAAENFRCFCTGEKGKGTSGYPLHYKGTVIPYAYEGSELFGGFLDRRYSVCTESIYGMHHTRWDHHTSLIAPRRPGMVASLGEVATDKKGNQKHKVHGSRFTITLSSNNRCTMWDTVVGVIDDLPALSFLHAISLTASNSTPSTPKRNRDVRPTLSDMTDCEDMAALAEPVLIQDCGELPN
ncbi:unnamed protein product [Vitrella brassicaformis CCMP3155]|uniref:PPIase cyclophilin-type domain-containing protein n=1 Tax=Vitrella brassicaformis (strain CCMP3155) TaxID=1169540 RepID=A0A0G4GBS9_VITBC|nr:unnamed protein product [Vitrella brassicaformis CCMP3155]|eukprot:CEM26292.1 unnamed protein product [Vitrella brassicaformis CCMP3155]